MAKASRKKSPKRKVATKKKRKSPAASRKKARKMPARRKAVKRAKPAKKAAKKGKAKVSTQHKAKLSKLLTDINSLIAKIKSKGKTMENQISGEQQKMFKTADPTEKLLHYFQIEGLKIDSFTKVEAEYKALSILLNKAYMHANHIGGMIRDEFLNICQGLSKGINLDQMEKNFSKMSKDLKKA